MGRLCFALTRIAAAAALLLVATLYLLSSIPFAYYHFLQFPHFWWMPAFITWHPLVFVAAVTALVLTLPPAGPSGRTWRRRLVIAATTMAACMAATIWLPGLQSYELSAALSFAPLAILIAANTLDLTTHPNWPGPAATERRYGSTLGTAMLAGLAAAAIYIVNAALREGAGASLRSSELFAASAVSIGLHVAMFLVAAGLVVGVRVMAARRSWPPRLERLAIAAVGVVLVAILVRRVVLTALDVDETRAAVTALATSVALVGVWMTLQIRWPHGVHRGARIVAGLLVIAVSVVLLPPMVRLADWGFTLQKLLVLATWTAVFALVAAVSGPWRRGVLPATLVGVCAAAIGVAAAFPLAAARNRSGSRPIDLALVVEQYATFDTALKVVLDVARPAVSDRQFQWALREKGEATAARTIRAVPLPLVPQSQLEISTRPNIFILVIDSLRPDYLSAYNPAVAFTPAIGAFARDSIVMRRAFTPYSGTGLSQPALWVGGLIPRLMYPRPFAPLNNLDRLLTAGRYRRYISVDQILSLILDDWTGVVRLDAHLAHPERLEEQYKFDLCGTLDEMSGLLNREIPKDPIFFYTQPQNLHIRVLGGDAPPLWVQRPDADRFYEPAATTVARLDQCFGRFVDDLKAKRLYNDSIIVLTSDHGDAYGEEGRWGHAFTVAPETLRIPLIIHVPDALRRERHWNSDEVAWLTDVTPTLYELLGQPPTGHSELAGRPLLARPGEDFSQNRRELHLVQSSYSRIFGLMDAQATWLYTADANRLVEQFFDLTQSGAAAQPLSQPDRLRYEKWLLEELGRLNAYYIPGCGDISCR